MISNSIRHFLLTLSLAGILTASPPGLASDTRPNIILLMADDLGWSDIGCYGGEIPTPHLDALARDGLRFRRFYNNAVCGPTRVSLLTGLYPQQVGHSGRHWNQPKDYSKCVLIPELLQAGGYRTKMVGKWQGRDLAVRRGFDRFFGPNCQSKISYFHPVAKNDFYLDDQPWAFPETGFYLTDAFAERANDFLQEALGKEQPFFLYLAFIAPHWPLHAPEPYIAPHRDRYRKQGWDDWRATRLERQKALGLMAPETRLAPTGGGIRPWKEDPHKNWQAERMAVYAAQVSRIDAAVGRLLKTLDTAGQADNTLVLFLSDNGAAPDGGLKPVKQMLGFAEEGPQPAWRKDGVRIRGGSGPENMPGPPDTFAAYGIAWATTSNTPLRGTKLTAYEGGIRTPLIARWPAVIRKGGGFTPQAGHVNDLMPTLLDVADLEYPAEFKGRRPLPLEGQSLLPALRNESPETSRELFFSVPRSQALISGDWKLVNDKRGAPWELFNLNSDPTETTNVARENPERVESMSAKFQAWQKRVNDE